MTTPESSGPVQRVEVTFQITRGKLDEVNGSELKQALQDTVRVYEECSGPLPEDLEFAFVVRSK